MRLILIPALALALSMPAFALAQHVHDAHSQQGQKLHLNNGKKWRTDAPLRKGMAAIRATTVDTIGKVHGGKATDATYDAAAKEVGAQLAGIIQNCKLAPAADAQLHLVISDIMAASEAMEGKSKQQSRTDGTVALARALNAYGNHFDDPGFKAIDLDHK